MHSDTSLPVAISKTSGWPLAASLRDVGAPPEAGGRCVFRAIQSRQGLAAEDQRYRLMLESQDEAPSFGHFVGVAGAHVDQAGNGTQRRKMLDGLVGGAILADSDRVVREDIDDRQFHDGGQTATTPCRSR